VWLRREKKPEKTKVFQQTQVQAGQRSSKVAGQSTDNSTPLISPMASKSGIRTRLEDG